MRGWVPLLIILLVLVIAGASLSWYFAYGVNEGPPRRAYFAGLGGPVEIGWHEEEDFASINARSEADAYAALGYVHGVRRAWTMLLWRQTALGQQAEWFGDKLLGLDGYMRRLEMNTLAKAAFDSLSAENQALLTAYSNGVNAALKSKPVRLSPELALLRVEAEPWQPWHTLAVERLFAWIIAPPPEPDTLRLAGSDAQSFFAADSLLRSWLHLHGFENSIAFAFADSQSTHFYQRHVYGSSALPFFEEVALQWPGTSITGATIPGTPFFPAGKTERRAWSFLPRGTMVFERALPDSAAAPPHYQRLRSKDGREQLIALNRSGTSIFFTPPPKPPPPPPDTLAMDSVIVDSLVAAGIPADSARVLAPVQRRLRPALVDSAAAGPDSTWAIRWSGFRAVTDWPAWRALAAGQDAGFQLVTASGLAVSQDSQWSVIGAPLVVATMNRGILVGNTPWASYIAQDIDSIRVLSGGGLTINQLTTEYRSEWASEIAPRLIALIDSIPNRAPIVGEALTYLRNWDFAYDRISIGAAIFDTWVDTYRETNGVMPDSVAADTVYFENFRRYQALGQALAKLQRRFGTDIRQWRWEKAYPDRRYFPVWSADSLTGSGPGRYASTRFAPYELPGRGHPSTIYWGPSPIQQHGRLSPAAWAGWVSSATWDVFHVRRVRVDLSKPLGRYRASERVPAPVPIAPSAAPTRRTTLAPPFVLPQ